MAEFLDSHPRAGRVYHPALTSHPDRAALDAHYRLPGSIVSFRLGEGGDDEARHFADVLATCIVCRYAGSFDGLATKINHHRTVSEYFTPVEELKLAGIEGILRLGVGTEEPEDLIACMNWALWNHDRVAPEEVEKWQAERRSSLGLES